LIWLAFFVGQKTVSTFFRLSYTGKKAEGSDNFAMESVFPRHYLSVWHTLEWFRIVAETYADLPAGHRLLQMLDQYEKRALDVMYTYESQGDQRELLDSLLPYRFYELMHKIVRHPERYLTEDLDRHLNRWLEEEERSDQVVHAELTLLNAPSDWTPVLYRATFGTEQDQKAEPEQRMEFEPAPEEEGTPSASDRRSASQGRKVKKRKPSDSKRKSGAKHTRL
jgi:hypothetical protein